MTLWMRRLFVVALAAAMTTAVACGDDNGETDNQNQNQNQNQTQNQNQNQNQNQTQNQNQNQNQNQVQNQYGAPADSCSDIQADILAQGIPEDEEYEPGDIDFDSDYELLFTQFQFASDSPGSNLNFVINNFIDQERDFPIIVLVELSGIDTSAETLTVRGGAGLHAGEPGGGEYVWDDELEEPDSAEGSIDEEGWFQARLSLFNFVATVQTEAGDQLKTIIPIRDLDLNAQLRAESDGSDGHIVEGHLNGVVWYEDAKDVQIALAANQDPIPLVDALDPEDINCDYSGDGLGDAWLMTATFDADETVIVD